MWTVIRQQVWRALRRALVLLLLVVAVLLGTGAAVIVQGGRDDGQRADVALVSTDGAALGVEARLARALDLYLKGQVGEIVLLGQVPEPSQAQLLNRGVQTVKVRTVTASGAVRQLALLRASLDHPQALDAILIAEPVEMLRLLKIAHDQGLPLRGAPTSTTSAIDLGAVIDEIGRYFGYALGF